MTKLRVIGKNIHLNIAEKEWLKAMQNLYGCTEQQALNEIIIYKREMAYEHGLKGNYELERLLMQEIDEWDDTREEEFKQKASKKDTTTIILP